MPQQILFACQKWETKCQGKLNHPEIKKNTKQSTAIWYVKVHTLDCPTEYIIGATQILFKIFRRSWPFILWVLVPMCFMLRHSCISWRLWSVVSFLCKDDDCHQCYTKGGRNLQMESPPTCMGSFPTYVGYLSIGYLSFSLVCANFPFVCVLGSLGWVIRK